MYHYVCVYVRVCVYEKHYKTVNAFLPQMFKINIKLI